MKRCLCLIVITSAFALPLQGAVQSGDIDLDFNFNWSSEDGSSGSADRDLLDFSAGVDYFITNRISLGGAVGLGKAEISGSSSDYEQSFNSFTLRLRYYILKRTRLVPYVGFLYRLYEVETKVPGQSTLTEDSSATGFMLGARYELTPHNDIYMEYQNLSYGSDWYGGYDGANKVIIGLIHQLR